MPQRLLRRCLSSHEAMFSHASKCLLNNCRLGGNNVIKLRSSEEMMATIIARNFLRATNVIGLYSDACFGLGVKN